RLQVCHGFVTCVTNRIQSRERFVMHLSSELQIASILAVLCHALQLAFQITPILAALCHAPWPSVTNRTNLGSPWSCTAASVTNHTNLARTWSLQPTIAH